LNLFDGAFFLGSINVDSVAGFQHVRSLKHKCRVGTVCAPKNSSFPR
jgi:hypothetical protein